MQDVAGAKTASTTPYAGIIRIRCYGYDLSPFGHPSVGQI